MGGVNVNACLIDNCGRPWDAVAVTAPDGRIVGLIARIAGDKREREAMVPDDAMAAQILKLRKERK